MRINEKGWKVVEKLLRPSTIFAFMIYGVFVYLCFMEHAIPDTLDKAVMLLLGFFFGQSLPKQKKEEKNGEKPVMD